MNDLKTQLEKVFKKVDIPVNNLNRFITFIETLKEWNKHITLISKREENILNHLVAPSLLFFKFFRDENLKIVDIGSGAGFPALVLKIYKPTLDITMIESNSKKCGFLNYICAKFGYKCNVINNRIEELKEIMECNVVTVRGLKINKTMLEKIKGVIDSVYLFHVTSKNNQIDLPLENELIFKNHSAKLYKL